MKKGMKIALIILAVIVIVPGTALAVWWPVSPDKLCKHEVSLLEKKYEGQDIPAAIKAEFTVDSCLESVDDMKLFHGIGGYRNYSSCMMKAKTADEGNSCSTSDK